MQMRYKLIKETGEPHLEAKLKYNFIFTIAEKT